MKIAVAGSIAMDQLMTFDGYFGELFREALPQVFVSFLANELVIRHSPGICRWSGPASWLAGCRPSLGANRRPGVPGRPDRASRSHASGYGELRDVQVRRCWALVHHPGRSSSISRT